MQRVSISGHGYGTLANGNSRLMKLALQGVSIFIASGDSGVGGSSSSCLGDSDTIFDPDFPAR